MLSIFNSQQHPVQSFGSYPITVRIMITTRVISSQSSVIVVSDKVAKYCSVEDFLKRLLSLWKHLYVLINILNYTHNYSELYNTTYLVMYNSF